MPTVADASPLFRERHSYPEDMYPVDQFIPDALVEYSSGPTTSVFSFKDLVQDLPEIIPSPNLHSVSLSCFFGLLSSFWGVSTYM